jgi:hypothetical protein
MVEPIRDGRTGGLSDSLASPVSLQPSFQSGSGAKLVGLRRIFRY